MKKEESFIISLLRKNIYSEVPIEKYEGLDDLLVQSMIIKNGILPTVYPLISCLDGTEKLQARLQMRFFSMIRQSANQTYEGNIVLAELTNAGFDCIALKGWELRNFYPKANMRQMVDIDILVRPYKYDVIREIMIGLGYNADKESSWKHDNFQKDKVHIEMHKRLTDDSELIQEWERKMWNRAVPVQEHLYKMTLEDFYIFHFIHMHKDFMNGSLGLRRIVDTWLLMNQSMDEDYILEELKKFKLNTFRERIENLARTVMDGDDIDENSRILLNHALSIGIYGTRKSYKAGRIARMSLTGDMKQGKIKSWIAAIFLPLGRMKAQFPILEKYPILLPVCWIRRIAKFFDKGIGAYAQLMDYSEVDERDYQEMKLFFKAGGVWDDASKREQNK